MKRLNSATERWLLASMWAAAVLPAAMFGIAAIDSYRSAFRQAEFEVEHAARIANEHALRVLQTNALAFDRLTEEVSGPSDEELVASQEQVRGRLRQIVDRIPALRSLGVWSADGTLLVASDKRTLPPSPGPRAFLQAAAPQEDSGYLFGTVADPLEQRGQLLLVSHRRLDAAGRFAGLVSAAVSPAYFHDFYTELARSRPGMAISLFLADGGIVTRMPRSATPMASAPPGGPMMRRVAAGEHAGVMRIASPLDGLERVIAFRRISGTPLYTAAGIATEVVEAQWRATVGVLALFTFPLAVALLVIARVAWKRTRREYAALHELNAEADRRLKVEAALRQAQKLEALGHLTGGVAHDVNNLLMVVNNNAHLMERLRAKGGDITTPLASIKRAVEAGARLTRQLLAFSRRQAWRAEVVDLRQWLPSVIDLLRHTLTRDIQLRLDVAPDVRCVEIDTAELELALINLAINARDAMPHGGSLEIRVRNAAGHERLAPGEYVEMAVTDTGTGIAPDVLERVFEPFFTTKEVGKGTGLGLSQVYGFCTQAGGTATVQSRPGAGTTVHMLLRATRAAAGAPEFAGAIPDASGRVLMVEDNDEVAQATGALLSSIGYAVERTASASQAVARLADSASRFDVVLCDIVMAGDTDGLELALALKRTHPKLPVLLMTGYTSRLDAAMAAGFQVIAKPCPPDQLAAALRRAMRPVTTI
jgi:two-component system NtrC family sensor kinase